MGSEEIRGEAVEKIIERTERGKETLEVAKAKKEVSEETQTREKEIENEEIESKKENEEEKIKKSRENMTIERMTEDEKSQSKKKNLEFAARIEEYFGEQQQDIRTYSPLTLAYIGDSVYDLVIRTLLVGRGNAPVNTLHRQASSIVKAEAQKKSLHQIEPLLTEEERSVYRRGRNAKSYTTAKNASIGDYRIATGFEALMGYLYLTGQMERLLYLVKAGLLASDEI